MQLPENYSVIYKNVRHVNIRVNRMQQVRVVAPLHCTGEILDGILKKKEKWIQKHLQHFRTGKPPIAIAEDELLYRGSAFRIDIQDELGGIVAVDEAGRIVRAGKSFRSPHYRYPWYRREAEAYFRTRVPGLAAKHGFYFKKLTMRRQKTRWGSCSKQKSISLNIRLIKAPMFVIDYVILHELVHTEFMNHSKAFWSRVKSICHDYSDAIQWLKDHGSEL